MCVFYFHSWLISRACAVLNRSGGSTRSHLVHSLREKRKSLYSDTQESSLITTLVSLPPPGLVLRPREHHILIPGPTNRDLG